MPKRSYPFPETFSSQYKIHIGQPELSKFSVFGQTFREEIYDKTKNLLFVGAKAGVGRVWAGEKGAAPRPAAAAEQPECGQSLLRGQTLIGHDGRLMRGSNAPGVGAPAPPTGCCVCQKSHGSWTACSQCDRRACPSCTRHCSSCSSPCCSVCTTIDYSGPYDEVLCCGCST